MWGPHPREPRTRKVGRERCNSNPTAQPYAGEQHVTSTAAINQTIETQRDRHLHLQKHQLLGHLSSHVPLRLPFFLANIPLLSRPFPPCPMRPLFTKNRPPRLFNWSHTRPQPPLVSSNILELKPRSPKSQVCISMSKYLFQLSTRISQRCLKPSMSQTEINTFPTSAPLPMLASV